jgi:hypothetical protein
LFAFALLFFTFCSTKKVCFYSEKETQQTALKNTAAAPRTGLPAAPRSACCICRTSRHRLGTVCLDTCGQRVCDRLGNTLGFCAAPISWRTSMQVGQQPPPPRITSSAPRHKLGRTTAISCLHPLLQDSVGGSINWWHWDLLDKCSIGRSRSSSSRHHLLGRLPFVDGLALLVALAHRRL